MERKNSKRILRVVREWNEFYTIPLGLLLFWGTPLALRLVDGTAGAYDLSVLQSLTFAIGAVCILKGCAWLLLRLDFPKAYRWLDDELEERTFAKDTPLWIKLGFTFGLFALHLLLLALFALALL